MGLRSTTCGDHLARKSQRVGAWDTVTLDMVCTLTVFDRREWKVEVQTVHDNCKSCRIVL